MTYDEILKKYPDTDYENESQLVANTLLAFGQQDNLWIWRENTGTAYGVGPVKAATKMAMSGEVRQAVQLLKSLQPITFGIPGRADISGVATLPAAIYGRPIGWEAKIKHRKRSPEQIRWADKFIAMGGLYVHFEQVSDIVRALQREGY